MEASHQGGSSQEIWDWFFYVLQEKYTVFVATESYYVVMVDG